jgi:hypothetical protein
MRSLNRCLAALSIAIFIFVALAARATSAAVPDNACALLTQQQVTALTGFPVSEGKGAMPRVCQWAPASSGPERFVVEVHLSDAKMFNGAKANLGFTATPISGLGDDAYFSDPQRAGVTTQANLFVKYGDVFLQIRIFGGKGSTDDHKTKAKAVAQAVLARL